MGTLSVAVHAWNILKEVAFIFITSRIVGLRSSNRKGILQYSHLENPMNSMRRKTDRTLKDELPRSIGAQYATGDQRRNNCRKNEDMEPKQKEHPVVDVTGDVIKD